MSESTLAIFGDLPARIVSWPTSERIWDAEEQSGINVVSNSGALINPRGFASHHKNRIYDANDSAIVCGNSQTPTANAATTTQRVGLIFPIAWHRRAPLSQPLPNEFPDGLRAPLWWIDCRPDTSGGEAGSFWLRAGVQFRVVFQASSSATAFATGWYDPLNPDFAAMTQDILDFYWVGYGHGFPDATNPTGKNRDDLPNLRGIYWNAPTLNGEARWHAGFVLEFIGFHENLTHPGGPDHLFFTTGNFNHFGYVRPQFINPDRIIGYIELSETLPRVDEVPTDAPIQLNNHSGKPSPVDGTILIADGQRARQWVTGPNAATGGFGNLQAAFDNHTLPSAMEYRTDGTLVSFLGNPGVTGERNPPAIDV